MVRSNKRDYHPKKKRKNKSVLNNRRKEKLRNAWFTLLQNLKRSRIRIFYKQNLISTKKKKTLNENLNTLLQF